MADIPHIIHYCWFGGNSLGENELACIESWKKYLPGYEIRRWDENNFDISCCDYVREAYEAEKWAFVSDYARYRILYENGGLYFDTDVELIASIDDILSAGPFMGFESDYGDLSSPNVAAGLLTAVNPGLGQAAPAGLDLYKRVLDSYHADHFRRPDGTLDRTSVVFRTTRILEGLGLKMKPGRQIVAGVTIYPAEFFNPKSYLTGKITKTANTRSIHHFSMSWFTPQEKFQHEVNARLLSAGIGASLAGRLSVTASIIRYLDFGRIVRHFVRKN